MVIKVNLKSGKKKVVAFKLEGPLSSEAPSAYVNFYDMVKNYAEIIATPYSFQRLLAWAEENSIELEVAPAVYRWLEKEEQRRKLFELGAGEGAVPLAVSSGLYPHQVDAVKHALVNSQMRSGPIRLLLADDPRLGKSAEALRIMMSAFDNGYLLILCPKALMEQWVTYVNEWLPYSIINVLTGSGKEREEFLKKIKFDYKDGSGKRRIVIIANWETLNIKGAFAELSSIKFKGLIGDEAHKLKNRQSHMRKAIAQIKTEHMLLLSATFTENWPTDYWSPLNLIEPDIFSSYWRFAGMTIKSVQGDYAPEFSKPKDSDILRNWISPWVVQRRSDDVVDMPEKMYEDFDCELAPWHRDFYHEVEKKIRLELTEGHLNIVNQVSRIARLRQAVIHPSLLDPEGTFDFDTGKFAVLKTLFENFIPENEQVLIYSNFIRGAEICASVLSDYRPVVYAGSKGEPSDIEKFQNGTYRVFCATPQKGGVGLNLFNANYLIYLDQPWSTITLRQSEERVRAMGKKGPVYIIRLQALDTVDDYVRDVLSFKLGNVTETEVVQRIVKDLVKDE